MPTGAMQYVDYIHGLLGRYNRKVIPACVVNHILMQWSDDLNNYTGFIRVDEFGQEIQVYELEKFNEEL